MRVPTWVIAAVLLVLGVLGWFSRCAFQNCDRTVKTRLTLDAEGGFAYVKPPAAGGGEVDIAFLKDVHATDAAGEHTCDVHQLGVRLFIASGVLVQPATQPLAGWDVANTTITFTPLDAKTSGPLIAFRGQPPPSPNQPADVNNDVSWQDLVWVASVDNSYSANKLSSTWLDKVSGRVQLTRGVLLAHHPTDPLVQKGTWELKNARGNPPSFTQAMTDATEYTVDVPGDTVTITLANASGQTPSSIVVKADSVHHEVKLKLVGVHDDPPSTIPVDAPLTHYCAFFQLLDPVPDATAWLMPHWKGDALTPGGMGQASPGGVCPGDAMGF